MLLQSAIDHSSIRRIVCSNKACIFGRHLTALQAIIDLTICKEGTQNLMRGPDDLLS